MPEGETQPMDLIQYYARDYRSARTKFLEAADAAGLAVETFENPATGPDGMTLFTDVATAGDPAADRVLLINSATHGAEGFCGSGVLVGWLRSGASRALPDDVRAVLVHAINPHGFAWLRRVTEDNVDLNRNFVDHAAPPPENPEYDALHPHLVPETWDGPDVAALTGFLDGEIAARGEFAVRASLSRGQYGHADGIFYGGRAPTWSNRTFRQILRRHCRSARHLAFLDFHTGLGPYGTAEMIARFEADTPLARRLQAWFGEGLTSATMGTSSSPQLSGLIATGVRQECPNAEISSITVEFGTYPPRPMLLALMADNWLHLKGDPASEQGRAIKADIRQRFFPDEEDWKELVYVRGRQIVARAMRGLTSRPSTDRPAGDAL